MSVLTANKQLQVSKIHMDEPEFFVRMGTFLDFIFNNKKQIKLNKRSMILIKKRLLSMEKRDVLLPFMKNNKFTRSLISFFCDNREGLKLLYIKLHL